jgi:hypothetical protein
MLVKGPSCQRTHTCVRGLGCGVVSGRAASNRGEVVGIGRGVRVSGGGSHQAVSGSGPCKIALAKQQQPSRLLPVAQRQWQHQQLATT